VGAGRYRSRFCNWVTMGTKWIRIGPEGTERFQCTSQNRGVPTKPVSADEIAVSLPGL